MTNNGCSKNLKTKLILVFTVACLLVSCLFGFAACKDKAEVTDPSYSYSDTTEDKGDVKNATFAIGSDKTDDSSFPITSASGWTKATDNSAASSAVNSGIVKLTKDSWVKTVKTLYSDSDFENYVKNKFGKSKSDIDSAIKADKGENYTVTAEDRAEYVADNFFKLPEKHSGENVDDYAYMLNNIRSDSYFGRGTAQKLTSSSSVSLEKGKTYKLSVWVKTENVEKNGANIRLVNSFGGSSQSDYRVSDIVTNGEWAQYAIYVKADKDYACSVTLVLGLGYGEGSSSEGKNYSEGTVFFDDVEFKKLDENEAIPAGVAATALVYGETDKKEATLADVNGVKTCAYDMNYAVGASFAPTVGDPELTKSNAKDDKGEFITSKTYNDASSVTKTVADGVYTYDLVQASATVKISDASFTVGAKKFFYLSFYVKNELNEFGSSDVTVVTVDAPGATKPLKTFTSVTKEDGWSKFEVLVKNNFESGDRTFGINLVFGPTDVKSVKYNSAFASGKVSIKDFAFVAGSTDKEDYVTAEYKDGTDNPEYKLYNSLLSSSAKATVALYAGNAADFSESNKDSDNYSLSYAPGNIGCIQTAPTDASGYYGIVSDHVYIKENGTEEKTNARSGKTGDGNGNHAGLINTKYLSAYSSIAGLENLADKLGFAAGDDDMQPLMIYNKTADNYGFIGTTQTVAASAYASVSVTVRVADDAKAYIYLVNASGKDKTVMSFDNFTVNTTVGNTANGTAFKGSEHELFFTVDKNSATEDGWVTVTFYVATGANAKDFRVEVWNGGRDGENKSKGFVFVKDITISTSSAFSEPSSWANAFSASGNPLYDAKKIYLDELVAYQRPLTSTETKFNKEYPDKAISYDPTYVWAKSETMIYAVYNTLDAVEKDPYANITDDDDKSGCAAETDPSTFWLSFSSILLGVVLVLAIVALVVKTVRRKRIANRSDAKTQYKVKSRIDSHKENQKRVAKKVKAEEEKELPAETPETTADETEAEDKPAEQQDLDSYVYGEVQDFGDAETNEEKPEETESENPENK